MPIRIEKETVEKIRQELPELPHVKRARYVSELGLPEYDAGILTEYRPTAEFFEAAVAAGRKRKRRVQLDNGRHLPYFKGKRYFD